MKNKIFYISVTIVLFLGVFTKAYNSDIYKYTVILTNIIAVFIFLKRKLLIDYIKYSFAILLVGHDLSQYSFLIISIIFFYKYTDFKLNKYNKYLYYFLIFGFLSYLYNQINEVNLLSFPSFLMTFATPIFFYFFFFNRINIIILHEIIDYLGFLFFIPTITALVQYLTYNYIGDKLTGGLVDAHILGFFTSISILINILNFFLKRNLFLLFFLQLILSFYTLFLCDSKYLLINLILSLLIILFYFLPLIVKKIAIGGVVISFIMLVSDFTNLQFSLSKKSLISVDNIFLFFENSAKFQLLRSTINLPKNEFEIFTIGSGPGTFLSRAANSRAYDTMKKKISIGGNEFIEVESKLPEFIPPLTSKITKKYAEQYFNTIWYGSLFDYRSSLISLFWEFGIFGFSLFFIFIFKSTSEVRNDKYLNFFIKSFVIFFILNSLLTYYFEYPKTQIIFWLLLGLFHPIKEISE